MMNTPRGSRREDQFITRAELAAELATFKQEMIEMLALMMKGMNKTNTVPTTESTAEPTVKEALSSEMGSIRSLIKGELASIKTVLGADMAAKRERQAPRPVQEQPASLGLPPSVAFRHLQDRGLLHPLPARTPRDYHKPDHRTDLYCAYHQQTGHSTDHCRTLKKAIQCLFDGEHAQSASRSQSRQEASARK